MLFFQCFWYHNFVFFFGHLRVNPKVRVSLYPPFILYFQNISYLQVIEVIQERKEKYLVKLTRCFVFDFTENKKILCVHLHTISIFRIFVVPKRKK